jgi:hypothetical protein
VRRITLPLVVLGDKDKGTNKFKIDSENFIPYNLIDNNFDLDIRGEEITAILA